METMRGENQSPKRIELQEIEEGGVDRISSLADCLLVEILSRLPTTKDAIKTGTLTTRWKHLWTSVPSLIFINTDYIHPLSDFISFVDKTLTQRPQSKLNKFEVVTWYDMSSEFEVNEWIRYAISCDVEELTLSFRLHRGFGATVLLDQSIFTGSCFTDLRLAGCIFDPTEATSWKNLKRLYISNGNLHENVIKNILDGSPVLETLVLDHCRGYSMLDITSKSVKNLVFHGYRNPLDRYGFACIQINAPNILSLTIEDELLLWNLSLLNVSSLDEANLNYDTARCWEKAPDDDEEQIPEEAEEEMLKEFIESLRHVKELKIGAYCSEVLPRLQAKDFILPPNVKFPDVNHG